MESTQTLNTWQPSWNLCSPTYHLYDLQQDPMPQFPHLGDENYNHSSITRLLWNLNENPHDLTYSKCSLNLSHYYYSILNLFLILWNRKVNKGKRALFWVIVEVPLPLGTGEVRNRLLFFPMDLDYTLWSSISYLEEGSVSTNSYSLDTRENNETRLSDSHWWGTLEGMSCKTPSLTCPLGRPSDMPGWITRVGPMLS
jgi:hypothetical protein